MRPLQLVVLSALLLAGCGRNRLPSSDLPQDPEAARTRVRELFKDLVKRQCDYFARCCPDAAWSSHFLYISTPSRCTTVLFALGEIERLQLEYAASQNAVSIDADAVVACLALWDGPCEPEYYKSSVPDICSADKLFVGAVPSGGPCRTNAECVADHYCRLPSKDSSLGYVCLPYHGVGGLCDGRAICRPDLVCVTPRFSANRYCTEKAKLGEPCADTLCEGGLQCPKFTLRCEPAPSVLGSSCTSAADCPGAYCSVTKQCAKKKSNGAPCLTSDECISANCDRATCALKPEDVGRVCIGEDRRY